MFSNSHLPVVSSHCANSHTDKPSQALASLPYDHADGSFSKRFCKPTYLLFHFNFQTRTQTALISMSTTKNTQRCSNGKHQSSWRMSPLCTVCTPLPKSRLTQFHQVTASPRQRQGKSHEQYSNLNPWPLVQWSTYFSLLLQQQLQQLIEEFYKELRSCAHKKFEWSKKRLIWKEHATLTLTHSPIRSCSTR